ncbi:hypothetical protein AA650_15460 [Anabaena sp. WA102]|nr:hypothetical protein AA650_15460 [Anabaena sp. WA102]
MGFVCLDAVSNRLVLKISLRWEVEPPGKHSQSETGNEGKAFPVGDWERGKRSSQQLTKCRKIG